MELLILIGLPASGKSTYAKNALPGHVVVSKDALRKSKKSTKQEKQMKRIAEALFAGRNVVVDNCNLTAEVRAPLIEMGKARRAKVIAMCFEPDLALSIERNAKRAGKEFVPEWIVRKMFREIERPTLGEGFDEILGRWS